MALSLNIGNLLTNIPITIAIAASTVAGGVTAYKVGDQLFQTKTEIKEIKAKPNSNEVATQNSTQTPEPATPTPDSTVTVVPVVVTTQSSNPGTSFTAAELATHNKQGDCYISYAGVVYSVSNNAQWRGCYHNGITGGQDITSRFPHPTSYLNTLPKVGVYTGPSGTPGSAVGNESENEKNENEHNNEKDRDHDEK